MSLFNRLYRLVNRLRRRGVPGVPRGIAWFNRVVFAADVPSNADVHESVVFAHNGLGVVVSASAEVRRGTKILHQVTIGGSAGKSRWFEGRMRTSPVIGEDVLIGVGAKVLGPIMVGDRARIGAGAVVLSDVPRDSVAVGIPAKVVERGS